MAEVWFYHLERSSALQELPGLLRRGLERGIRMAVVTTTDDKLQHLSQVLWGHEDIAFLPHGTADEPNPQLQPIFLTVEDKAQNNPAFWFYVDGATPSTAEGKQRTSILFQGDDEEAKSKARELWKRFKAEGHAIRYWKQDEEGRWKDQASG